MCFKCFFKKVLFGNFGIKVNNDSDELQIIE